MTSSIADYLLCTMQGKTLAHRRRYACCSPWGSAVALQMAPAEGIAQLIPAGFARIETGARQALRARRCRVEWGARPVRCVSLDQPQEARLRARPCPLLPPAVGRH